MCQNWWNYVESKEYIIHQLNSHIFQDFSANYCTYAFAYYSLREHKTLVSVQYENIRS
jgi:uncharacterized protein YutD